MNYQFLCVEVPFQGATLVTINRPDALNALNLKILQELDSCVSELEKNSLNRILILTGAGKKAFVAGADIASMKEFGSKEAEEFSSIGQATMNRIDHSSLISIAAINGFALGGGMELALACDIRIASSASKLGLPEVSLGLIPGFGGTQRLTKLLGSGLAMELILTGDMISAEDAFRVKLINRITTSETLLDETYSVSKSILSRGPIAIREAKRVIKNGNSLDSIEGFRSEKLAFAGLFGGSESKEGLSAFLEKRKPGF
jgi:enoyl-CoA hydratase